MIVKNQKQTRGEAKNAEIVAAARELFLNKGYSAVSMDLIADTAAVSKRTVYSHFESKEKLFGAVMMDLCRETCPPDVAEEIPDQNMSPELTLITMGVKYLSVNLLPDAIALYRVVLCEGAQFPELADMYWQFPNMLKTRISECLTEWNRQGLLSVAEPNITATHFIGMLRSPLDMPQMFTMTNAASNKEIKILVTQVVSIFLNGLKQA